jgi:hypothetical protein
MPSGAVRELAWYLRRCTPADAPVLVNWFAPEVYYFAQRPFAAGMVVFFGEHWVDRQAQMLEWMRRRPPSLIVLQRGNRLDFNGDYPLLAEDIERRYQSAGSTAFQLELRDEPQYDVLVPRGTAISQRESTWNLPCPVGRPE